MPEKIMRVNQSCYAIVIKRLLQDDATIADLAEVSGLHYKTVEMMMRTFKSHGLVHISDYLPDIRGRDLFIVYRWGQGKDKKKFRMPSKEKTKIWRDKKKMANLHPTSLLNA